MTPVTRSTRPVWRAASLLALLLLGLALLRTGPDAAAQAAGRLFLPVISRPAVFRLDPLGEFDFVTTITGGPGGLLLVGERGGRVWSLDAAGQSSLFLDISSRVLADEIEQGLQDIAFDPDFSQNGFLYVSYTSRSSSRNHVQVSRFRVPPGASAADRTSELLLFRVSQDTQVHHGGGLAFGPRDGLLYVSVGEGFQAELAQRDDSARGKIVRLAVANLLTGSPPPLRRWLDADTRVDADVWAKGLRNPWQITFDTLSGDLYVGDVGFHLWEEVDVIPHGRGGLNFGWPCREGPATISVEGVCAAGGFEPPIHAYQHGQFRCAVIGGVIARPPGSTGPGRYVAGDFCSREIFTLQRDGTGWVALVAGQIPDHFLTTFGQDAAGRLYVGSMGDNAPIYRLTLP